MSVKLVSITQGAGELVNKSAQDVISYVTRVSNPSNQMNFETSAKLLAYCIKHKHWSPFEHAFLTLEITTSRAIAAQILRHRSFTFQEFSMRYAENKATDVVIYEARRQDTKNRQNSIDDLSEDTKIWFKNAQEIVASHAFTLYQQALKRGIAKECSRMLLPLNTQTKIYMSGSCRSWLHYILLRSDVSTQLEHRVIAEECKKIFCEVFPDIGKALEWTNS